MQILTTLNKNWAGGLTGLALLMSSAAAHAVLTTIPQSSLTASTTYYTDKIGGGLGSTRPHTGGSPRTSDPIRNDDAFFKVDLGFTYTLFGTPYTSLFINTNGNVSFKDGIAAWVPQGPLGADQPVISAWFGDVDTRPDNGGNVFVRLDSNQLIVTWDQVGYFNQNTDRLNSFQMIIRGDSYVVPSGEGTVGFWWKGMPWEDTETSNTAAIGFGTGTQGDGFVLEGSNASGLNAKVANRHIWFDTSDGSVELPPPPPPSNLPIPEPQTYALMLAGLAAVAAAVRRRRGS